VAEVDRRAEDDDNIDDIRGHELLHQLKIAVALALIDGLRDPTDEYWYAARVVMQVRDLTQATLMKVITRQHLLADRKRGRSQGRSQAEARRAEAEAKNDHLLEVATRICDVIRELAKPATEAEIYKKLSKSQIATAAEAIAELVQQQVIEVVDHNTRGRSVYWFRPQ
jgi:hypothetical protein